MRYKFKVILAAIVSVTGLNFYAQKDSVSAWKFKSLYSLNGTQSSFVNWNAGGRNNISLLASFSGGLYYSHKHIKWSNDLNMAFGGVRYLDKNPGLILQKTDDRVDFSSIIGHQFSKYLFTSFIAGFKTQMVNGYAYPNDSVRVSTFMAPGYLNLGLGIDYIKSDNFSIFTSPIAAKSTFVMDKVLSDAGAFGVEKGKRYRQEFGAYIKMKYNHTLAKNIEMKSKLELFSNYLHKPQNIDINAELQLLFRINAFISTTVQWNLIYDDDVNIRDAKGKIGPRTQFKSVIGVGLSYKLESK